MRFAFLFVGILCLAACAHPGNRNGVADPGADDPFSVAVKWYRGPLGHLSAVRSGGCPMHPSCSTYARECLEKKGALRGIVMTFDRLIRCGRDETRLAPKVFEHGRVKVLDPVSENDLW